MLAETGIQTPRWPGSIANTAEYWIISLRG